MLTFKELQETSIKRCTRWHNGKPWTLSDWATATTGELGEACNVIKKINRIRDGINTQDHDLEELEQKLAKELADTIIYLDLLATHAGINLEKAVTDKFNEVSDRYGFPEKLPVSTEQQQPGSLQENIQAIMDNAPGAGMSATEVVKELRARGQMPELHTVIDIADVMKEMYGPPRS